MTPLRVYLAESDIPSNLKNRTTSKIDYFYAKSRQQK